MLCCVPTARKCRTLGPKNIEATVYALLAGFSNFGQQVSNSIGSTSPPPPSTLLFPLLPPFPLSRCPHLPQYQPHTSSNIPHTRAYARICARMHTQSRARITHTARLAVYLSVVLPCWSWASMSTAAVSPFWHSIGPIFGHPFARLGCRWLLTCLHARTHARTSWCSWRPSWAQLCS